MDEKTFGTVQTPAGKGKAKAKAKANGNGNGSTKKTGNGSRPAKLPCLNCPEMRHANSRWCKLHKRAYDSMAYQAKVAEKNGHTDAQAAFTAAMSDDISAKNEIAKFCELNPPDQRYARKQFIDWAAFKTLHGQKTEIIDRSKCAPMWEGEFIAWAKNVKALPEAEAQAWWKEHLSNPRIDRDHDGYKGRLQLWIPKGISKITDKSKYTESFSEQGNKPLKDPKETDIDMLKEHVLRQQHSVVDPFFYANLPASASQSVRPKMSEGDGGLEEEPAPKRFKVDVDRAGPKLVKTMEKDMKAICKTFQTATDKCEQAKSKLESFPREMLLDDLALLGLLRSLDLRVHFLQRFVDNESETTQASMVGIVNGLLHGGKTAADGSTTEDLTSKLSKTAQEALSTGMQDFEKMKTMGAMDIINEFQARLPFKESDTFLDEGKLRAKIDEALRLQKVEDYEALKGEWQVVSASATSVGTSMAKVAGDIAEHLDTKVREAKRQKTRNATAERAQALKAIRDQAKKAAEELKAKPKTAAVAPVFGLDPDTKKDNMEAVPVLDGADKIKSWSTPWVVKDWEHAKACLSDSALKKSLETFAAQYRKLVGEGGRHQYALQAGAVKAEVDKVLQLAMPSQDGFLDLEAEDIDGGGKFMAATWLYGFGPDMSFCNLMPNAASQIRVHVRGEVNMMMFDWHSFCEKMQVASEPFSCALALVSSLTDDKLKECKSKGVQMWEHTLVANELLYLPVGCVAVETCCSGSTEVYGIRKSFFPTGDQRIVDNYKTVLLQFGKDKRSVGAMESVSAALDRALKKQSA